MTEQYTVTEKLGNQLLKQIGGDLLDDDEYDDESDNYTVD